MSKRPGHGRVPSPIVSSSSKDEREAEEKWNVRRRTEAKATIEFGNIINGTGSIDDNDDDDDEPPMNVPPRTSMAMGMGMNAGNNIPFPTAVGPIGLQGQWGTPGFFGGQLGNLLSAKSPQCGRESRFCRWGGHGSGC